MFIDINTGVVEVEPAGAHAQALARGAQDQLRADRAGLRRGRGGARRRAVPAVLLRGQRQAATCSATASTHEVFANRFQGTEARGYDAREDTPFIAYDPNRCILCGRCVSVCREVQQCNVLDFAERGFDSLISTSFGRSMVETDCEMCGNCVSACPTGALMDKLSRVDGRDRRHHGRRDRLPLLRLRLQRRAAGERRPRRAGHVPGGRGPGRGQPVRQGPLRLPVHRRTPTGSRSRSCAATASSCRPPGTRPSISCAERFAAIKAEHGADAFVGFSSARCTNEDNYLFQKFMRAVIGTQNVDHCARLCHATTVTGLRQSLGQRRHDQLVRGPRRGRRHPHHRLQHQRGAPHRRAAHQAGAAPRRQAHRHRPARASTWRAAPTSTCSCCSGTNVAVINGIMNVILDEGLADEDVHRRAHRGVRGRCPRCSPRTRRSWSRRSPACRPTSSARRRASSAPPTSGAIFYSMGITQHSHGTEHVLALSNLALLTGNLGRRGTGVNPLRGQNNVQGACDMGALPNVYTGYQAVGDPAAQQALRGGLGRRALADKPGLGVTEAFDAHGRRRRCAAVYVDRREPDALGPRPDARRASRCKRPRLPGRAGHLPQRDGRAGRRRAAGGELRREGRHVHQHRAQGAARARRRAEPGRGARRLGDHRRARAPARRRRRLGLRAPRRHHGRDQRADALLRAASPTSASTPRAACAGRAPTRRIPARPSCTSASSRAARASSSRSPTSRRRRSPATTTRSR